MPKLSDRKNKDPEQYQTNLLSVPGQRDQEWYLRGENPIYLKAI